MVLDLPPNLASHLTTSHSPLLFPPTRHILNAGVKLNRHRPPQRTPSSDSSPFPLIFLDRHAMSSLWYKYFSDNFLTLLFYWCVVSYAM